MKISVIKLLSVEFILFIILCSNEEYEVRVIKRVTAEISFVFDFIIFLIENKYDMLDEQSVKVWNCRRRFKVDGEYMKIMILVFGNRLLIVN